MINILIVEDSKTETILLKNLIEQEKDMHVIGCATNGEEAVKLTALLKPDLITMDIQMPIMDGLAATRLIMMQNPTPIIVISSTIDDQCLETTFDAMEAGALSALSKPFNIASSSSKQQNQSIVETIRNLAEIKVIKKRFHLPKPAKPSIQKPAKTLVRNYELIAIGASVGGPQALKFILSKLPKDFPIPIVVVQHMTPGFITGFTKWLNNNTALTIKNAENQEHLTKGTVYFAPDHCHLEIIRSQGYLMAHLVKGEPISGFYPSITALLRSVVKTCGKNAIGGILTGMGSDGADGLFELKKAQGHTFIQDAKSAVVFGMAGVAQSIGAVDKVVELNQIADYLISITRKHSI